MSQPVATPEDPETADEGPAEAEQAPANRAERRARARRTPETGHAGPPPDRTLRRGRGPRSHTKRG
jgi:hypothetical protein